MPTQDYAIRPAQEMLNEVQLGQESEARKRIWGQRPEGTWLGGGRLGKGDWSNFRGGIVGRMTMARLDMALSRSEVEQRGNIRVEVTKAKLLQGHCKDIK